VPGDHHLFAAGNARRQELSPLIDRINATADAAPPPRNRWFVDSPLEGMDSTIGPSQGGSPLLGQETS
jgi:hypothetical protein